MITTGPIKLTSKKLFEITLTTYLKRKWWLFAWIWVLAIILVLNNNKDSFDIFLIFFLVLFPIVLVIQFWRYAYSKQNKIFLLERYYEIETDTITGKMEDGTTQPIKIEHFIKVISSSKYYLLYIAKAQFIYVPFNSFKNITEKKWFEDEIVNKIKK
jgi:hypothetical protein